MSEEQTTEPVEEIKSTHKCEVVKIHLTSHGNADSLSVVEVFSGYTVVVRTQDWDEGQLAAYVVPDSVVDTTHPEFSFLAKVPTTVYELLYNCEPKPHRVQVKRLRGVYSMGMLVPAPEGSKEGDDVAELLGVTRYEPPLQYSGTGGDMESPPPCFAPAYDVDDLRRYAHVFKEDEEVVITEKIHGANARYVYDKDSDRMYAGAHHHWKKYNPDVLWWKVLVQYPEVESFCREYPGYVVYAEVYGWVQELHYGAQKGEVKLAVYDIRCAVHGQWLSANEALQIGDKLPWVPALYITPVELHTCSTYNKDKILALAEGPSLIPGADHAREGIVVKPLIERYDPVCGRVNLKVVSNHYLEKSTKQREKAEKKKADRGDRQPVPHKHKWNVVDFKSYPSLLFVKCNCEATGEVTPLTASEMIEAWDSVDKPYPFRSDYRRVQYIVKPRTI